MPHYKTLIVLELFMMIRLASNLHRSVCLCLTRAGIKGVCLHAQETPLSTFVLVSSLFFFPTSTLEITKVGETHEKCQGGILPWEQELTLHRCERQPWM